MPLSTRSLVPLAALALALVASAARAQSPRLVSADDHGVTFRVDVPQWRLDPDSLTHRMKLVAPGFDGLSEPGRAFLPATSTLIALPPGARASASVVAMGDEDTRDNVALTLAGRPGWEGSGSIGLGLQPTIEDVPPVLDGPWPVAQIELGEPFTVRHQRMVAVRVMPFRYDEATGRLWVRRSLTVRVTFSSSPGTALRPLAIGEGTSDATLERGLLNPEQSRRFRSPATPAQPAMRLAPRAGAQGAAAFGFDEDQPEVRVKVDTTGVLGLLEDDLEAHGFPTGVPVAEVSVHRHEFLENSTPPYATVEIPCEVVDSNTNGVFDSGDAIYVYAQTWLARARPSMWQRQWGDADYVYATRVIGRAGLRVATRAGWRGATGLTPLPSYPLTTHYEHDSGDPQEYNSFPPDTLTDPITWVSGLRYYTRPDTFLFNANDLDTTRAARLAIQFIGRRTELRLLWAQTRNGLGGLTTVLDSVPMFGNTVSTFTVSAPASVLTDGRNNLKVWTRLYPNPPDPVIDPVIATAFNWFEVTHWRGYRAIQGYLPCTSADGDGEYQVKADRFASNAIEVWDVADSTQAVRLVVDPSHITQAAGRWSIEFQDSTSSAQPRRYVVFDTPRFAAPEAYGAVTRRPLTGGPTSYDYLLVIPGAWEGAVAPLVAAREAQGLRVLVAPYEAIRDQFNGGRASAHAVKRLIRYAYNNWSTRYVTLMGDAGGQDGRQIYSASSLEWVPTMMIPSPVGVSVGNEFGFELIPSDSWYGWCVDPDCIPTPDPRVTPGLHDVYVGRLPVNSAAEAADIARKLAAYDTVSAGQTWRREMTLLADDLYSGDLFGQFNSTTYCRHNYEAVFEDLNRRSADIILNEAGLAQSSPEVFSMAQYLANEDTVMVGGSVCRPNASVTEQHTRAAVTPLLVNRLNAGKLWWNYHGHANQLLLSHEWIWMSQGTTDDWRMLANTDRPFFFSAFSCHANAFTNWLERDQFYGQSVGEEMVNAPRTGAIASWASTGFELIPSQNPNLSHISLELTRALFSRVPPDTSLVQRGQGDPYAHPVLGDAIALALLKWVPQVINSAGERNVGLSYELLGDPATRISIAAPQSFVTANGLAVTSGAGGAAAHARRHRARGRRPGVEPSADPPADRPRDCGRAGHDRRRRLLHHAVVPRHRVRRAGRTALPDHLLHVAAAALHHVHVPRHGPSGRGHVLRRGVPVPDRAALRRHRDPRRRRGPADREPDAVDAVPGAGRDAADLVRRAHQRRRSDDHGDAERRRRLGPRARAGVDPLALPGRRLHGRSAARRRAGRGAHVQGDDHERRAEARRCDAVPQPVRGRARSVLLVQPRERQPGRRTHPRLHRDRAADLPSLRTPARARLPPAAVGRPRRGRRQACEWRLLLSSAGRQRRLERDLRGSPRQAAPAAPPGGAHDAVTR